MNDAELRFKASVESLERLHSEYIEPWRPLLETRSSIQVQPSTVSVIASQLAVPTPPIVINDYVRMCYAYCITLWMHWKALGVLSTNLDELRLIRNCLEHHEGDMAAYSQNPDVRYRREGVKLITLTQGKSYVQGYNLVISGQDLLAFTAQVKAESMILTGVVF